MTEVKRSDVYRWAEFVEYPYIDEENLDLFHIRKWLIAKRIVDQNLQYLDHDPDMLEMVDIARRRRTRQ